ncbi:hypothetical protein BT96DRAFT_955119 [Gymnopus androsaceus JB14]|uniref:Phosphomethylpyrimidine kinase n=1 Tax=Gymnopus androsaceus JB14 TaxID=1447944 RepID=A0A6A4I7L8_9AGAR|nr:hypothetical protein BT96DRAFT_955119 [Gymnopus androsaceus JB14]
MTGFTRPQPSVSVLTIAGSDSSGGAGIQTFAAHQCYGTSAITALTAQNTTGVQDVFPSSPEFLEKQITSILSDIHIKAIKTGMLFDANITRAAISALKSHYPSSSPSNLPPIVCDPVCVSTSGHSLLNPDALGPEELLSFGPQAILLKGGHLTASMEDIDRVTASNPHLEVVRDGMMMMYDKEGSMNMEILKVNATSNHVLCQNQIFDSGGVRTKTTILYRPRIESTNTHGTGCTLSAAITARLALGFELTDAVRHAAQYTHLGIESADSSIGHGNGPLNHFHSMEKVTLPRPTPSNPYPLTTLLILRSAIKWKAYVEHDFVKLLGKGTLPRENFVRFIKQDYLYLRYYARAYALLAAKSPSFPVIHSATQTILNILHELNTHRTLCASFGVSEEELENTSEEMETGAYGGYLIDVGLRGDTTLLLMALLACLLGYGEVGLWLKKNAKRDGWVVLENNPYVRWIEDYSGNKTIEARAVDDPPSTRRLEGWSEVWERCTELEKGFWDMAMKRG